MEYGNDLIKKMFKGILITNVVSMIASVACTMIDAMITGQFLGADAVTAAGLTQPVIMFINLLGGLTGMGLGTVCTRYLGKARPDRVVQVYSIVAIVSFFLMLVLSVLLYLTAPGLAHVLASKTGSDTIISMISDYCRGYSFGLLPYKFNVLLAGVMVLDNDKKRSIMTMVTVLIADVIFDLANVLVFHGGMYGMAVATSLSNLVGLGVIMTHFLRKDRLIRFTTKGISLSDMIPVMQCGIPNAISMGGLSLRLQCFNMLLLAIAGTNAVAAFSVSSAAFSAVNALVLGIFASTAMLCGLLYGEEDRHGLEYGITAAVHASAGIFAVISMLLILFARPVASLFVSSSNTDVVIQGASFIRAMALGYLIMIISFPLSGAYQGTKQLRFTYFIDSMREIVLPVVCVISLGRAFGIHGVEAGFVAQGLITLLICFLIPWKVNRRRPASIKDLLVIPDGFGAKDDELYEKTIRTEAEVAAASEEVRAFCEERGADRRTAMMLSLFVEETAMNTISHGFREDREGRIDLRLVYHEGSGIIRFRDDGRQFDPVDWLKRNCDDDPAHGMGIRMIVGLSESVSYMASMGMNNLIVKL